MFITKKYSSVYYILQMKKVEIFTCQEFLVEILFQKSFSW